MKTLDLYTKFRKKGPQKAGTLYVFHVNVRTPGGLLCLVQL